MTPRTCAIPAPAPLVEHRRTFACFGGECTVIVADAARCADAAGAAVRAKQALLRWHEQFSRFEPDSELMRLNGDERPEVPVSPLMGRMIEAALTASRDSGGLVDATLGAEIRRAGYGSHFEGPGTGLAWALAAAPSREPAGSNPAQRWRQVSVDRDRGTVTRAPGTSIDVGGIAKGVFADELAGRLAGFDAFAIDCAGDIRLGGRLAVPREIHIASPFEGPTLHTFEIRDGAVATSGIGRRTWLTDDSRPAHHLLDPRTGKPAFTGVVQVTALAPSAAQAEGLAKAAVLSGPERAGRWLTRGGVVVNDDGTYVVLDPAAPRSVLRGARSSSQAQMSCSTRSRSGSFRISWNRPS